MFSGLEKEHIDFSEQFNQYTTHYFKSRQKASETPKLWESMEYSFQSGGKRFRPFISYLLAKTVNRNFSEVQSYALAVEMIHTYSLIHDDLPCMDNDDLRRGVPTNHKVYGEAQALLAGDALLTEAFYCIASDIYLAADQKIETIKILSDLAGSNGMISGQWMDITGGLLSEDFVLATHRLKTANLIMASALGTAELLNFRPSEIKIIHQMFYFLGLAFQIKDDLLDQDIKSLVAVSGVDQTEQALKDISAKCISLNHELIFSLKTHLDIHPEPYIDFLVQFNLDRNK